MPRSISTVFITLFLAATIVPAATAQMEKPGVPMDASPGAAAIATQPASDSTNQAPTKTDMLPEHSQSTMPIVNSSADRTYPDYCPSLPPGTKPGDWEYREALERCLYGN